MELHLSPSQPWLGAGYRIGPDQSAGVVRGYAALSEANPAQSLLPLDHPGGAGLLWAINGGRLVELHPDWAVIELAANGSRHDFESRRVDAGGAALPWLWRGRRPGDV